MLPRNVRLVLLAALLATTGTLIEARQKPPSPPPLAPVSDAETMRGRTAMSVSVVVDRQLWPDLEVSLRGAVQRRLNELGIKILPEDSYPQLRLAASAVTGILTNGGWQRDEMKVFSISLELAQLLPLPGTTNAAVAATWQRGRFGIAAAPSMRGLARQAVAQMLGDFETAWVSVNPLTLTAAKPASATTTYTPSIKGRYYEYTGVPEEFVPPLPDALHPIIRMPDKRAPGSLVEMSVKPVDPLTISMAGGGSIHDKYQNGEYWAPLIEDLNALAQAPGILNCQYLDEPRTGKSAGSVVSYFYWLRERPAIAEPARLKARIPEHPLLVFRPALAACPADGGTARRLR